MLFPHDQFSFLCFFYNDQAIQEHIFEQEIISQMENAIEQNQFVVYLNVLSFF